MKEFKTKQEVTIFPQEGGWYYIPIPEKIIKALDYKIEWGLIPVNVQVGKSKWKTSLMPKGDGTYFVPLNAKVRNKEDIDLGSKIEMLIKSR